MEQLFKYILLAIIQGISEILPISSSGHLLIFESIFGINENNLTLAIFLHFGSLIAVLIYYRKLILDIIVAVFKFVFKKDRSEITLENSKLFLMLIIATIPAAILGLLFNDFIENTLSSLWFVFSFLLCTGVLLLIIKKLNKTRELKSMTMLDALLIGCFQGVGILPGISRSGSTIFGLKTRGFNNDGAAKFAFLMFIPVSLGSFLLEMIDVVQGEIVFSDPIYYYIIGIIVAGITTFLALKAIFGIIKKGKLHYFAFYCFLVGVVGLIYMFVQLAIA